VPHSRFRQVRRASLIGALILTGALTSLSAHAGTPTATVSAHCQRIF